jgi:hypothetical protein
MKRFWVLFSLAIVLVLSCSCTTNTFTATITQPTTFYTTQTQTTIETQTQTTTATQTQNVFITQTPTVTITKIITLVNEVSANSTLSATTLKAGDRLTIHSEIQYICDTTITGLPIISITGSDYYGVAGWYLDKNGHIVTQYSSSLFYQIEQGKKYIMDITWDLRNQYFGNIVSPGQYKITISIAQPYKNGYMFLETNEGSFTITIK